MAIIKNLLLIKNIVERGDMKNMEGHIIHIFFQSIFTGSLGRWGTPLIVS